MSDRKHTISDERLTAFLDGALGATASAEVEAAVAADAELAARLAALDVPMDAMRAVMAPQVLNAPGMPEGLMERVRSSAHAAPAPEAGHTPAPRRRSWLPTAAIAASFAAGVAVTYALSPTTAPVAKPGWIDVVASYQALYVKETLETTEQEPQVAAEVLARAAEDFGVSLTPALTLEGLDFKRAQMLAWNGKPLLQMAYLDQDGTPIALCLTRVGAEDRGALTKMSNEMAGVSWVRDGVGYVLIGGDNPARVEALSAQVIAQL